MYKFKIYCNYCRRVIEANFKKPVSFDGRFCSKSCKEEFETERAKSMIDGDIRA